MPEFISVEQFLHDDIIRVTYAGAFDAETRELRLSRQEADQLITALAVEIYSPLSLPYHLNTCSDEHHSP